MTMASGRSSLNSELRSELRSVAIKRQDSVKQMYAYPKRDNAPDISAPRSWAASSLSLSNDFPMVNVLDELRKKNKKKKKKPYSTRYEEGRSIEEVQRLQLELQERFHRKPVSLYSADGAVNGDRKASLELTKKSILEEIRRKSGGRRRRSTGRYSSSGPDDYGLLGSTQSNVLDELKKNSKKKRRARGSQPGSDDGTDDEPIRPGSRSPIPSTFTEDERTMHQYIQTEKEVSQFEENKRALSKLEDRDRNRDNRDRDNRDRDQDKDYDDGFYEDQYDREDFDRSATRFDDYSDQDNSPSSDDKYDQPHSRNNARMSRFQIRDEQRNRLSQFDSSEDPRRRRSNQDDPAMRVPPKSTLHSELKKRFKSPSRSRSLMYKYSNYRHEADDDEDMKASHTERASLHQELQTRVKRTAPRYSRHSMGADAKASILDELKSRVSDERGFIGSRSLSNLDSALRRDRDGPLDEGGSRHSASESRGSGGGSRGSGGKPVGTTAGSFYIPGITAKARTLDSDTMNRKKINDDETEETHDETVCTAASSSFFIPGINGTARCLNGTNRSAASSRRRASAQSTSTNSDESSNSVSERLNRSERLDRSDRPDRPDTGRLDRSTRSSLSHRRTSNSYGSYSNSDDSGDKEERWDSRRRSTNVGNSRRSELRRRGSSPARLRSEGSQYAAGVDLDDIIRGAQSKLGAATRVKKDKS